MSIDPDEPNNPSYHDVWGIDEYGDAFRKLYILKILNDDFRELILTEKENKYD